MREAAVILFAAAAFAFAAWSADWPAQTCQPVEIIRYLHVSEPAPIYPVPALIKATEIQPPAIAEESEDRAEPERKHRRRWFRRHRRH